MKLSVCILNWNTADTLKRTLDLLNNELNVISHEVIVIDQGSVDKSCQIVSNMIINWNNKGLLSIVCNDNNLGISKGKNQGIDLSKGEYVLLLDGDIVPVRNSIIKMVEWLNNNKNKHAIGMYPNRWTEQENKPGQESYESYCNELYQPKEHSGACLFYGMYRRKLFDDGLRCCEKGELGKPGYGWEDHDFFFEMKYRGIIQYVAHINNPQGHYLHKINSSLKNKNCLPKDHYRKHYDKRKAVFNKRWKDGSGQSDTKSRGRSR